MKIARITIDSVDAKDLLSHLAEPVIHNVMTFLRRKDAVRTSTLSKKFLSLWHTFPIIDYEMDDMSIDLKLTYDQSLSEFMNNVHSSIQLRLRGDVSWEKFRIRCHMPYLTEEIAALNMGVQIKQFIDLAMQKNVKVIDISCGMMIRHSRVNLTTCKSLKSITLEGAHISDAWIQRRVFELPRLEKPSARVLEIVALQPLDVSNLVTPCKLKKLELCGCDELQEVKADTRNLSLFEYRGGLLTSPLSIDSAIVNAKLFLEPQHPIRTDDELTAWLHQIRGFLLESHIGWEWSW
ncbi:FBD-associated F-box protein At1g66310-like [Tripterygium wilfordii]|uniref:FBD-associated F-box protein At1g66310-like n=1 Tax=Tripterygium wilfordii TaxID=458696 RepID=UPI0018F83F78|nr:FBD-associated F-box protein At1g66310-like [Tripterygium wilfordii]